MLTVSNEASADGWDLRKRQNFQLEKDFLIHP
jgi:hypothetical protein